MSYNQNIEISYKLGQSNIFVVEIIIILCVKKIFIRNKNVWLVNKCYINMLKGKKRYLQWNICCVVQHKITKMAKKNYEILHTGIEQIICFFLYIYFMPKKMFVVNKKGLRGNTYIVILWIWCKWCWFSKLLHWIDISIPDWFLQWFDDYV